MAPRWSGRLCRALHRQIALFTGHRQLRDAADGVPQQEGDRRDKTAKFQMMEADIND